MTLHPPFIITPRLMPGLSIGGAFISMSAGPRNREGRKEYSCYIDLPCGYSHKVTDLRSGCQGGGLQEGFASLLSFLGAAAESYGYNHCEWDACGREDNATIFPREITEWASEHEDAIAAYRLDIEESETPLIE